MFVFGCACETIRDYNKYINKSRVKVKIMVTIKYQKPNYYESLLLCLLCFITKNLARPPKSTSKHLVYVCMIMYRTGKKIMYDITILLIR